MTQQRSFALQSGFNKKNYFNYDYWIKQWVFSSYIKTFHSLPTITYMPNIQATEIVWLSDVYYVVQGKMYFQYT